jgi:hypothetical protein
LSYTADHYREIWFFYKETLLSTKDKKLAKETTLQLFRLKPDKFKYIKKWAKKTGKTIYPF